MKKRTAWIIGGAVALALCCGGGVIGGLGLLKTGADQADKVVRKIEATMDAQAADKKDDVTIDANGCKSDDYNTKVALTIKNSGAEERSYLITVALESKDGVRLGEASAAVNSVKAGQIAKTEAFGSKPNVKDFKCIVVNVL